jgi:peptide/nickel transport system permease protein
VPGLVIVVPLVLVAVCAPLLPLADPLKPNILASLDPPSFSHPFGTDKLGRDVLSRTIQGLRASLLVGVSVAGLALVFGVVVGTVAGFVGGTIDTVLSAVIDVFLSFPSLLLAIGVVAIFGPGLPQVIGALFLADLPRAARLQRSLSLGLKSRPFMDAARMASAPTWWILVRHVLPNTVAPMAVIATVYASNAILAEAALSFLGLGLVPPAPSLGNLVSDGRHYLQEAWWISTIPGLMVGVASMGLHLLSDGLRQKLDPRLGL